MSEKINIIQEEDQNKSQKPKKPKGLFGKAKNLARIATFGAMMAGAGFTQESRAEDTSSTQTKSQESASQKMRELLDTPRTEWEIEKFINTEKKKAEETIRAVEESLKKLKPGTKEYQDLTLAIKIFQEKPTKQEIENFKNTPRTGAELIMLQNRIQQEKRGLTPVEKFLDEGPKTPEEIALFKQMLANEKQKAETSSTKVEESITKKEEVANPLIKQIKKQDEKIEEKEVKHATQEKFNIYGSIGEARIQLQEVKRSIKLDGKNAEEDIVTYCESCIRPFIVEYERQAQSETLEKDAIVMLPIIEEIKTISEQFVALYKISEEKVYLPTLKKMAEEYKKRSTYTAQKKFQEKQKGVKK